MGYRILEIADVFLPVLMEAGEKHYWVGKDALPPDCRIVDVRMDFRGCGTRTLVLLLESTEWDDAPVGKPRQKIEPSFTQMHCRGNPE